jgi:hypothetical protein
VEAAVEVAAAGESAATEAAVQAAVQAVQVAQQSLLKAMPPQTPRPAPPASDATEQLNSNSLLLRSLVAGQHHLGHSARNASAGHRPTNC